MEYVVLAVVFLATLLAIVGGTRSSTGRRIAAADVIRSRLLDNTLQIAPAAQSTLIRSGRSPEHDPVPRPAPRGKGFARPRSRDRPRRL
jgi:hypothetical protein